jgi:hypothetical protein
MGNIVKPMKPEEVLDKKIETIPDAMFEAVNAMIALKWNGRSATFRQDDLMEKFFQFSKLTDDRQTRDKLFAEHALDFEDAYRREGWKVVYDKPAYNESYEPTFEFTIIKK